MPQLPEGKSKLGHYRRNRLGAVSGLRGASDDECRSSIPLIRSPLFTLKVTRSLPQ